jgi:DNA-binding NarL/FixJ family response regulator
MTVPPAELLYGKPLSKRETQITELMSRGYQNAEIAKVVHMTEYGVITSVKRILRKLGAANRTEAAVIAVRKGLI